MKFSYKLHRCLGQPHLCRTRLCRTRLWQPRLCRPHPPTLSCGVQKISWLPVFSWGLALLFVCIQPAWGQVAENFPTLQELSKALVQANEPAPASKPVMVVLGIFNEVTQKRDAISEQAERQLIEFLRQQGGYSVVKYAQIQMVRDEWLHHFPESSMQETNENVADLLGADWIVTGVYHATETALEFQLKFYETARQQLTWQGQTNSSSAPPLPSAAPAPTPPSLAETPKTDEENWIEKEPRQELVSTEPIFPQEKEEPAAEAPRLPTENMVFIPEGTFLMGRVQSDEEEQPRHAVYLPSYYLDTHEVTNVEYSRCMDCQRGSGGFDTNEPQQPVVYVDWENAARYCRFVGKRLPTEAEWEKGARAGNETEYFLGKNTAPLDNDAWHGGNSAWQEKFHAQAVGLKQPNAWGLYDMAGNVMEWTSDAYTPTDDPPSQPNHSKIPDEEYSLRVVRGGAWLARNPEQLHSANRFAFAPWVHSFLIGFRCAADVPPTPEMRE